MRKNRVYIAAASAEMERAQGMMGQVAICPTLELALDWTQSFNDPRVKGLTEAEIAPRIRREFVNDDVAGVLSADFLWLLAPGRKPDEPLLLDGGTPGLRIQGPLHTTKGAWFELGVAHTAKVLRGGYPKPIILVSGEENLQSIFTEVADHLFESDQAALRWLKDR